MQQKQILKTQQELPHQNLTRDIDLARLKSETDKLDFDELEELPV